MYFYRCTYTVCAFTYNCAAEQVTYCAASEGESARMHAGRRDRVASVPLRKDRTPDPRTVGRRGVNVGLWRGRRS